MWNVTPKTWDEGAFLGNGLMGLTIFVEENNLVLEVGRQDVIDTRKNVDMPISFSNARLPIGRFVISPNSKIKHFFMELSLFNAIAKIEITTCSGKISLEAFVHSEKDMIYLIKKELINESINIHWQSHEAKSPRQKWGEVKNEIKRTYQNYLTNPKSFIKEAEGIHLDVQNLLDGGQRVACFKEMETYMAIHIGFDKEKNIEEASTCYFLQNKEIDFDTHTNWWNDFYKKSFISIPDSKYEGFYYIQLYKLASATRSQKPLIDNQGPWLFDTAWPYATFNLNVQLTYLPLGMMNHLELAQSLIECVFNNADNFITCLPEKYQIDSAAIDTVGTYECKSQMRDPNVHQAEIANLVWLLHNCYDVYLHSMNEELLLNKIYPLLKKAVNFILHFTYKGEDGKYHIKFSSSPEYPIGAEDCNYNIALLNWGLKIIIKTHEDFQLNDDTKKYMDVYNHLTHYPKDDAQGFYIGANVPYSLSHRHYSHLLMIYPLNLLTIENGNSEIILKSLKHWQSLKDKLRGYSFTGASSISSMLEDGDRALYYLSSLWEEFLRPNTFYKESGPVIETPIAGATAILEMMLQSYNGVIKVFPAISEKWKNACFHNLSAKGGFIISANYSECETKFVRIKSLYGGDVCIKLNFKGSFKSYSKTIKSYKTNHDGFTEFKTNVNDEIIFYLENYEGELIVKPVLEKHALDNCYGLNDKSHLLVDLKNKNFDLN